jgi:cell division protease FtsH
MDYHQIINFIMETYEESRKGYDLKFNDSIIFVIGNLDEAYEMSFNVNPDMSPDQFKQITEEISIVDIKKALKNRFRNEQIARLGNIHVIYPSFSSKDFEDIISLNLDRYEKDAYNLTGIHLTFDKTIRNVIYDEGVFPTQGTRPIFSTIHEIVKSHFPIIVRNICENGAYDSIKNICYTFDNNEGMIIAKCSDANGENLLDIKLNVKLRLKKLRDSDANDDLQALNALHESGHFVMYAKLFGKMPEKLVSRTTDSMIGGFLMNDFGETKKKVSKKDMMDEIKVMLGGYVAEKMFFGEEATCGASSDLYKATQLASRMVRRYGMGSFTFATTNVEAEHGDESGMLLREENQSHINRQIKDILTEAETEVQKTFMTDEWKDMLKESALYLCNNSAMPKEKMQELYDKVADNVKGTFRSGTYYRDKIAEM